jgi:hypothetical protein
MIPNCDDLSDLDYALPLIFFKGFLAAVLGLALLST